MATFTPLFEPTEKRGLSEATRVYRHPWHPLLSPAGQAAIRSQLSIADWLLIGGALQAVFIFVSPFHILYSLAPTFLVLLFKILKVVAITYRIIGNPHMKDVRVGRQTAIFPNEDGSFDRQPGEAIGGKGMCLVLLNSGCNHPLGMFHPRYVELSKLAVEMYKDLEKNAAEYGFLGFSSYQSNSKITKAHTMQIMYFASVEHLYKWTHNSKSHRDGFNWWNKNVDDLDEISISHEIYSIPEAGFENIYDNTAAFDFGATKHAIESKGKRLYLCPLVDANKSLKKSAMRMGRLQS